MAAVPYIEQPRRVGIEHRWPVCPAKYEMTPGGERPGVLAKPRDRSTMSRDDDHNQAQHPQPPAARPPVDWCRPVTQDVRLAPMRQFSSSASSYYGCPAGNIGPADRRRTDLQSQDSFCRRPPSTIVCHGLRPLAAARSRPQSCRLWIRLSTGDMSLCHQTFNYITHYITRAI